MRFVCTNEQFCGSQRRHSKFVSLCIQLVTNAYLDRQQKSSGRDINQRKSNSTRPQIEKKPSYIAAKLTKTPKMKRFSLVVLLLALVVNILEPCVVLNNTIYSHLINERFNAKCTVRPSCGLRRRWWERRPMRWRSDSRAVGRKLWRQRRLRRWLRRWMWRRVVNQPWSTVLWFRIGDGYSRVWPYCKLLSWWWCYYVN